MSSNSPRSPKRKQSTIKSDSQQSNRQKSQLSKKGTEPQKSERSDQAKNVQAMQKKIENNDEDLAQLKRKLAIMKQMPQPENKEEMITFLI